MPTPAARVRLQEIHTAFRDLAGSNEGLSLLPGPPPGPGPAGQFTLQLVGDGSARVELRVRTESADLTARSGCDHASAGNAEIQDHLGVDLVEGFNWDGVETPSGEELAVLLLKHMRRRLKAVAEVMPQE